LRKMRAEQNKNKDHEGHENMTEEEHAALHAATEDTPESEWPEWNDEFAKTFGDFKTADELKEKIKSNIKTEKTIEQKDKVRLSIVEELVKQTEGDIPEILIQSETDKMLYKLEADITNIGFKVEDYLKQINKTEADLRGEWRADAEKRAKLQMIIHTISEKENLKPTEEEIEADVLKITEMYKDADPSRARAYVEQMLENEKVFHFLEQQ
ncbi:MAG: Trigger factor, partial [Candidatus Nomurabacteria bacterium GW2011_GWE1_35_16]